MKSILIIGMGRFGCHLCKELAELGNQIMIVDQEEDRLEGMFPYVVSAKIGDCTNEDVLKSLGIGNFDIVFVCIGTNFQSSLETTSLVKELGAKYVVSKANRDIHAKFLLKNGADEVIYPDRDIAEKVAVSYSSDSVFDYIELTDEFSIYEIAPLPKNRGDPLQDRATHSCQRRVNPHKSLSLLSRHKSPPNAMAFLPLKVQPLDEPLAYPPYH